MLWITGVLAILLAWAMANDDDFTGPDPVLA